MNAKTAQSSTRVHFVAKTANGWMYAACGTPKPSSLVCVTDEPVNCKRCQVEAAKADA